MKKGFYQAVNGKIRKKVYGVGTNIFNIPSKTNGKKTKEYVRWVNMLRRAYSKVYQKEHPSYKGISVCKAWLEFSNFRGWFLKHHREGFDLDKDLTKIGNKQYCPEYCCFIPQEVNKVLTNSKRARGNLPIGVCEHKTNTGTKYKVQNHGMSLMGYRCLHKTPDAAFSVYKLIREAKIKEVAEKNYNEGNINKTVYCNLLKHKIMITD